MAQFLTDNILNIVIVVLFIVALVLLYKSGKKAVVKKIILGLVIQAEKTLGSGTGELKYALVVERIYSRLPSILTFLFTKKEIDQFIEEGVNKLKEILSSGEITLTGYDDEHYIKALTEGSYNEK